MCVVLHVARPNECSACARAQGVFNLQTTNCGGGQMKTTLGKCLWSLSLLLGCDTASPSADDGAEVLADHERQWHSQEPEQYVVQTCTLGIEPPGCERAAVSDGKVQAAQERVFSAGAPGWETIDVRADYVPPLQAMFDHVRAGEVAGCPIDQVEYDQVSGYVQRYTLECEQSTSGGRWVACFEPDTQDLAACAVVPEDAEPDSQSQALMRSKERWMELVASEGDSYWYEEENCAPNMITGIVTHVQVDNGSVLRSERSEIPNSECKGNVNRFDDFVARTMPELYELCGQFLADSPPEVTLGFDERNVLTGCVVASPPDCDDNCGEGFLLRDWGFGMYESAP